MSHTYSNKYTWNSVFFSSKNISDDLQIRAKMACLLGLIKISYFRRLVNHILSKVKLCDVVLNSWNLCFQNCIIAVLTDISQVLKDTLCTCFSTAIRKTIVRCRIKRISFIASWTIHKNVQRFLVIKPFADWVRLRVDINVSCKVKLASFGCEGHLIAATTALRAIHAA